MEAPLPLAAFGFLLFLVLLAPTSSVVPISDPLVERRMYLPLVGLILLACEAVGRWRMTQAAAAGGAAALLILALLTYQRATLWGRPEQMWIETAERSSHKSRPWLHLSELLVGQKRCEEAISYLQQAERRMPEDGMVQVGIARAEECLGQRDQALARLQRTAVEKPSSGVYQWLGLLEGAMGRSAEQAPRCAKLSNSDRTAPRRIARWDCGTNPWAIAKRRSRSTARP